MVSVIRVARTSPG